MKSSGWFAKKNTKILWREIKCVVKLNVSLPWRAGFLGAYFHVKGGEFLVFLGVYFHVKGSEFLVSWELIFMLMGFIVTKRFLI